MWPVIVLGASFAFASLTPPVHCGRGSIPVTAENIVAKRDLLCALAMGAIGLVTDSSRVRPGERVRAEQVLSAHVMAFERRPGPAGRANHVWNIHLVTNLTFDIEVELGRDDPHISVQPTHKWGGR